MKVFPELNVGRVPPPCWWQVRSVLLAYLTAHLLNRYRLSATSLSTARLRRLDRAVHVRWLIIVPSIRSLGMKPTWCW
jgi:hypothetical protein